jgi:hypothetical protein
MADHVKPGRLFGREPAAYIPLVAAGIAVLVGFGMPGLNDGIAAGVTAFLTAAAGLWVALRTRPIAPAVVMTFVGTAATLAAAFKFDVDQQTVAAVAALLLAYFGLDVRSQARPAEEVPPESAAAILNRPKVDAT